MSLSFFFLSLIFYLPHGEGMNFIISWALLIQRSKSHRLWVLWRFLKYWWYNLFIPPVISTFFLLLRLIINMAPNTHQSISRHTMKYNLKTESHSSRCLTLSSLPNWSLATPRICCSEARMLFRKCSILVKRRRSLFFLIYCRECDDRVNSLALTSFEYSWIYLAKMRT